MKAKIKSYNEQNKEIVLELDKFPNRLNETHEVSIHFKRPGDPNDKRTEEVKAE
jgi:hypothetical protein